jgi:hypothetical protein
VTKRQRIEEYLERLSFEQLRNLTVREITSDLNNTGLEVTERYVCCAAPSLVMGAAVPLVMRAGRPAGWPWAWS